MCAMNKGKVYIFDLDGTLADSMPVAVEIVLDFLRERKIAYPDDIVNILMPLGFQGIAKYYAEVMGVPMTGEEIYAQFRAKLAVAYANEIPLKPMAKECVQALKNAGVRICVLTASPHIFTDPCLRRTGIFDLFDKVWSSEDFGTSKGDPDLYRRVAEALETTCDHLVMVDDCLNVLRTAKTAGLSTVGVYDGYSADDEAEMRKVADGYVYKLTELL